MQRFYEKGYLTHLYGNTDHCFKGIGFIMIISEIRNWRYRTERHTDSMNRKILILLITVMLTGCGMSAEQEKIPEDTEAKVEMEEETNMSGYRFEDFSNVEITGIDVDALNDNERSVLLQQARYCQAMTEADIDTMREIVSEDMIFTHMSGKQQTREEYFADIARGRLNYFTIGIENPVIETNGDFASITFTSVLNANAYGARGTFRMSGTHHYEKRNGEWIAVNR